MRMFVEIPQNLILVIAGAFLLGWLLSALGSAIGRSRRAGKRDRRDDQIRELTAELRIARGNADKASERIDGIEAELKDARDEIGKRDNVITHQQDRITALARDLKESVIKTRELRAELSDRATENIKSEVKLREVETELSVAHASQDLLATGVLDYSVSSDGEQQEVSASNEDDDVVGAVNQPG